MRPFPNLDSIHSIAVPITQIPDLGTANVFVLGSGPITLIDTGFKSPDSYEYLKEQLKEYGHDLSEIERIIITHGHLDHFGLAAFAKGRAILYPVLFMLRIYGRLPRKLMPRTYGVRMQII
jgi:glyoxylase-like metal-dependent hydrolase (beta-lactamase superfamily II)